MGTLCWLAKYKFFSIVCAPSLSAILSILCGQKLRNKDCVTDDEVLLIPKHLTKSLNTGKRTTIYLKIYKEAQLGPFAIAKSLTCDSDILASSSHTVLSS